MFRIVTLWLVLFAALASAVARADIPPPYEPYGIGASLADAQPFPTISALAPGSPAAKAGLEIGDGVIAINRAYAKGGAPFYFFARAVQGPEGSSVELIVLRDNREVMVLSIERRVRLH